jgi:hypothetical protein
MAIPAKDVLPIATAMMPQLLMKALPNGAFRFGGEYASPHPNASPKRQRDYRADIVVRSNGGWADNLAGARGSNIISLLAHIQYKSPGMVGAELARTLNPMDALNGQIVPPGLRSRSRSEDVGGQYGMLSKARVIQRRDGGTVANALVKLAQEQKPRFRRR